MKFSSCLGTGATVLNCSTGHTLPGLGTCLFDFRLGE